MVGAALEVGKVDRVELVAERSRPVVEHVRDRHMVGDAEGEVQVGVAIAAAQGERAHDGSGDDAFILLREPEHAVAQRIPLLNGEHDARSSRRSVENRSS